MKRLRKDHSKLSDNKIVYYCVGEYGSKRGRPHYHMLILNTNKDTDFSKYWQNGFVLPLPAKSGSIPYVLKYMSKQKTKVDKTQKQPEFSLMSKGIGANYLTEAIKKYHTANLQNCYYTKEGGYKSALPKYYKEKLYNKEQRPRVTKILQQRAEDKNEKTLKFLLKKSQNPETLLDIRKKHLTFDKRTNENVLKKFIDILKSLDKKRQNFNFVLFIEKKTNKMKTLLTSGTAIAASEIVALNVNHDLIGLITQAIILVITIVKLLKTPKDGKI